MAIMIHGEEDEPYQPPESLWQFIRSLADAKELDVIKSAIGEAIVETSVDLHNEIDTLLEIWRDYRNETLIGLDKMRREHLAGQQKQPSSSKLAEPANVRDTLKKEIRMYVGQLREHFKNDEAKFRRQIVANEHNLKVINYVLNSSSSKSTNEQFYYDKKGDQHRLVRPRSAVRSDTGAETPLVKRHVSSQIEGESSRREGRRSTVRYRSQSVLSSRSRAGDRIRVRSVSPSSPLPANSVNITSRLDNHTSGKHGVGVVDEQAEFLVDEDKLNCMQIDDIVDSLREMLQNVHKKESNQLLSDIEFLYECIDDENEYRYRTHESMPGEPTLNELKEERRKLESDLVSAMGKNQLRISKLPNEVPRELSNRSINSPVMAAAARQNQQQQQQQQRSRRVTPSPPAAAKTASKLKSVSKKPTTTTTTTKTTSPTTTVNATNRATVNGRPNSVDDSLDSPSSSSSSTNSNHNQPNSGRVSSAQKFRKMVFEWRD